MCEYFDENNDDVFDDLSIVKIIKLVVDSQLTFYGDCPDKLADTFSKLAKVMDAGINKGSEYVAKIYDENLYPEGYTNSYIQALDAYIRFVVLSELYNNDGEPIGVNDYEEATEIVKYVVCQAIIYFRTVFAAVAVDQETDSEQPRQLH